MAILSSQFNAALSAIEPSDADKANAPLAHTEVRDALTSASQLSAWQISPVLIGSYRRDVSIRRVNDVDVFCRMESIGTDVSAEHVLDEFFNVLDLAFGRDGDGNKRVRRQARSLSVDFPEFDGLHVDAVPARKRDDGYWEIPSRDGSWQMTNPEQLTYLKTAMNDTYAGNYVPLVKLLRQTRRAILKSRPGGLFVELALYEACASGSVSRENLTLGYVTGLEAIADYLADKVAYNTLLPDPTMPGHSLEFRATDLQWQDARDRFAAAAKKARMAYVEEDSGQAALAFRELLGKNGDDEDVFPMPPGYDDDGAPSATLAALTPGRSSVPAGDPRFA